MRTRLILGIVGLLAIPNLQLAAQNPASYYEATLVYAKALSAFAASDFDIAQTLFKAVDDYLLLHPSGRTNFDHVYREFSLLDLVRRRQALEPINPRYEHKVLALIIEKTDVIVEGQHITANFTQELLESTRISLEVCRKYVETLSGGRAGMSYDIVKVPSTLRGITGQKFIQGDISSLDPYPREEMALVANKYDTVMVFYNSGLSQQVGNSFFTAYGGLSSLPIIPGILMGPRRGILSISSALADRPGTLFHELFHTFEAFYGISPGHGYLPDNRAKFPDWKGTGEFDYYRYQYERIYENPSAVDFSPLQKYTADISPQLTKRYIERFNSLKKEELQVWSEQYKELFTLVEKSTRIPELGGKLLAVFPESPEILLKLGIYHHFYGDKNQSFAYMKRAYDSRPSNYDTCYFMGVAHYHQGLYDEADKYLGEAAALSTKPWSALWYRAWMHYVTQNYPKAERDFLLVMEASPDGFGWARDFLEPRNKNGDANARDMLARLRAVYEAKQKK